MPSASSPENASPESFTTTRCQRGSARRPAGTGMGSRATAGAPFTAAAPLSCLALSCTGPPPWRFVIARSRGALPSLAHLEAGEAAHGDPVLAEHLLDRLLRVLHEGLLDQDDVLEERVQPPLHDLRDGLLGLALAAGQLFRDAPLLLD